MFLFSSHDPYKTYTEGHYSWQYQKPTMKLKRQYWRIEIQLRYTRANIARYEPTLLRMSTTAKYELVPLNELMLFHSSQYD